MAILSNINGLFAVDSTGAIKFNGQVGTSGYILKSNGNAAPTWVDPDTVIGGPYLPLTGGTLSGNLAINGSNSLTVGGALSAGVTTITSDTGLLVYSSTNAVGANITFSDVTNRTQKGFIKYFHQDTASYGSGNAFIITGDQATMTILADGKLMYNEGVYLKPATGTGAGTRKDNLWDAAYNDKITALAVTGTTTKTLTATQQDGGTLTATWTDNDGGGTVTGTGANTQVAFWTGTSVIDGSSDLIWDNTNKELGIGRNPDYSLDVYKSSNTSSTATGTTMQRLWNYVGGDLGQQKTFIDFVFQDANDNQYPQVRIGAEVGQNGEANSTIKEGSGAFVVYTNNANGSTPGTNVLAERMRVDYAGNVGVGTTSPLQKFVVAAATNGKGVEIAPGTLSYIQAYDRGASAYSNLKIDALNIQFGTNNGTERMRIDSGGYILMGKTSGSYRLDMETVAGGNAFRTTRGTSSFRIFQANNGASFMGTENDADLNIQTNSATRVVIDNSGKVGIGTTSPLSKTHINGVLTIKGSDTGTNGSLAIQDDYSGINHLSNIGWNRSSGGPYMTYGLKQDGSADWKSTFANFSGERTFIKLDEDTFTLGHAPAQNTAVGTVVTDVTEKFRFDLENGRLGLGTSSPGDKLDVVGAILANNRVQIDGVDDIGNVTGSADSLRATGYGLMGNRPGNIYITNGNSAAGAQIVLGLQAAHNGNNKLVIGNTVSYFNNNKLLVNKTTDDGGQLQVATTNTSGSIRIGGGNGAGQSRVYIESNGNSSYIDSFGDSNYKDLAVQAAVLKLQTHSSAQSRSVDVGGQVWRGYANNPIAKLNVEVAGGRAINIYNTDENGASLGFVDSQSNGSQYGYISWSSGSGNPMVINNMGQDAITINSSGYVGINNTSPQTPLHVGTTTTVTNQFTNQVNASNFLVNGNANGGASFFQCKTAAVNINMMGNNDFACNQFTFYHKPLSTSQNVVGTIATFSSSTQYNTTSDYRLKENVISLSDSITRLKQLKPSRFNFIEDPERTMDGFLAHEVQDIVPEAVNGEKDAVDENGNEVHQGIDQAKLVPLLVAAIQELEARVKELENK